MMMLPAISSLVLATKDSTFGFPSESSDALNPTANVAMQKRLTKTALKRLQMVGDSIDACEAQRLGLVDFLGTDEIVENEVARLIYRNCAPQTQCYMSKVDMIKAIEED